MLFELQSLAGTKRGEQGGAGGYVREKGEAHLVEEPIFALCTTNVLWSYHIARSINCQQFHQ